MVSTINIIGIFDNCPDMVMSAVSFDIEIYTGGTDEGKV